MTEPLTPSSILCTELRRNHRINVPSVDGNVLATILNAKVSWMERMQNELPLETITKNLKPSDRSFEHALQAGKTKFILECKKASPSKGLIRPDFSPKEIAKVYANYADAVSVLADEKFFQGSYSYIKEVRNEVKVPVLCKDFIYDPYQVYLARYSGGDAILLMLSIVTDEAYIELSGIAKSLGMGILTEASGEEEIARAVKLNAKVIGINNRNLRNLTVDLGRVAEMAHLIPDDRIKVSESGIFTHDQIMSLHNNVKAFLIGSSLTSQQDIESACRRLIFGENKICGMTRLQDVQMSWASGFAWNGFIFWPKSSRYIKPETAKEVIFAARNTGCKQRFTGVFVNAEIAEIVDIANDLKLDAIQLHGSEDIGFAEELKKNLPYLCQVWKAIPISDNTYPSDEVKEWLNVVDRVVLDTKKGNNFGGTGDTFDWNKITASDKSRITVAGGLNTENLKDAIKIAGVSGYDLNSGIEEKPGIKDCAEILKAGAILRNY